MAEYIEREAADNAILNLVPKVDGDGYCWVIRGDAARAIDSIPAADVRPVVLCKDCKHNWVTTWNHGKQDDPRCDFTDRRLKLNDFCSRGEKREGNDGT